MTAIEDLYTLIPAGDVDDAVTELERKVLPKDIEVRSPQPGRYRLLDEALHEDVAGAGRGALLGATTGAILGLVVAAVLQPDTFSVWLLIAFCFAAFGTLIGGVIGLQRREAEDDDPIVDVLVDDPDAVRLLVVQSPHEREWARKLLERNPEVRVLDNDTPLPDDAAVAPAVEHIGDDADESDDAARR